ncbi:unnamed protein product [Anisakis simplex]|uniref:F-box domain-containing protein n=1 Tax=Anisakis simplex TaxID=6269 RepID=A0A0M3JY84_ANISI|nr:unnamed protein product [Anisakis simplex]
MSAVNGEDISEKEQPTASRSATECSQLLDNHEESTFCSNGSLLSSDHSATLASTPTITIKTNSQVHPTSSSTQVILVTVPDVVIKDPCHPSNDGMYPNCGMGCSINGRYPLRTSESAAHSGPSIAHPEDITSPVVDSIQQSFISQHSSDDDYENENENGGIVLLSNLPDLVLLKIIEYIHPIERVHHLSVLSRRWNKLVKSNKLWSEVRIFIADPPYYKYSVAEFLRQKGSCIQKLCINIACSKIFTERQFIDLFPSCMPTVKCLDIGFFPNFTIDILRFFMRCFPNVEYLNLEGMRKVDPNLYDVLFTDAFKNLRHLILSHCEAISIKQFELFCRTKRPLEVLSIDGIVSLRNCAATFIASSPFVASLTRLYLDGEDLGDFGFRALTSCCNLELLSVSFCESATDLSLGYIKTLSKIEHLHLRKGKEFTFEGFRNFFALNPSTKTHWKDNNCEFPSRLKFLNLGECTAVNDVIVDLITKNCPQIRSLCLVWCWSITEIGLQKIVQRLDDLQLLDIAGLDCVDGSAFIDVPDLYLSNLRYLGAEQCPRIEDSMLQILNLRKKDLIITNYHDYFITFTIRNGDATFNERIDHQYMSAVTEELCQIEGFCCMSKLS